MATFVEVLVAVVSNVSARFSTLKSECRNIYLPHYLKETKIKKSGEYVDDDILLNIYEIAVKVRIDTNCYKAKHISELIIF